MIVHQASLPKSDSKDIDTICQYYLNILYHDAQKKNDILLNDICDVYGEVLYPSVDKLLSAVPLSDTDVFVDYGSGLGKMVIQVFLKSLVKEAYGIEILPELNQQALIAAHRLQHDLPEFFENQRKLTFLSGSFLELRLASPTVAMIVSTCFTQSVLNALGTIIEATPSLHTVLTLRPIRTLKRLPFKKTIRIECSWDTVLCYVYSNKNL